MNNKKNNEYFPSIISKTSVIVIGKWIRIAMIIDEYWLENQTVTDPKWFVEKIKQSASKADIFSFSQKFPDIERKYDYFYEKDNVAVVSTRNYKEWWERLPQIARKNVRRGEKRGVSAKIIKFNDDLVRGVMGIHADTPLRQGVPFSHYGKDFNTVKKDYGTFIERSEFIGSFFEGELIGLIKLVYMGDVASIMQIISKQTHYDKRPTNILIAKAVEVCEKKGKLYLIYGKYIYGNKTDNSLTDFKKRNGFEKIEFPRYYIPLTLKGKIAIKFKLHRTLLDILPNNIINILRGIRSKYFQFRHRFLL